MECGTADWLVIINHVFDIYTEKKLSWKLSREPCCEKRNLIIIYEIFLILSVNFLFLFSKKNKYFFIWFQQIFQLSKKNFFKIKVGSYRVETIFVVKVYISKLDETWNIIILKNQIVIFKNLISEILNLNLIFQIKFLKNFENQFDIIFLPYSPHLRPQCDPDPENKIISTFFQILSFLPSRRTFSIRKKSHAKKILATSNEKN